MSGFISKDDYKYQIRTERLDQILEATDEDEDALLEEAEDEAIAVIRDYLISKYDVDLIFSSSGDSRPKNVLRWAKTLVIYYIYERIPDEMVPERVVKNYDDTLETLENIARGDMNVDLPKLSEQTPPFGQSAPKTRRRMGSKPPRTNDGGSPRFIRS